MALKITGWTKVKTLKQQFKDEFGLSIRIYDGRSFADNDASFAQIRKGDSKGGEFAPQKNTKVGNLEDKIEEMFGIKTQISGSDDSYLCDNDLTLKAALEEDELKMSKKEKKATKKMKSSEIEVETNQHDFALEEESYMTIQEVSEEYEKFENEMRNIYHQDNVLLIRDRFKEFLIKYAEEYKDLIEASVKDEGYDDVGELLKPEYSEG